MDGPRKRRKWDVASPAGMPLAGNRAGIGAGSASQQGLNGFITAQGHQIPSVPLGAANNPLAAATSQTGAGHTPNQSIDQATIARAQQGAQAIVERINAELRAKGQLPASRGHDRFHDDSREIAREVIINDAPPPIRYNLTKRSVQDDIQRRTNTIVVIKGRYHATGMLADDQEGPLRLRIMPGNVGPDDMVKQRAVDAGATEVRRILQGTASSRPLQPAANIPPPDRAPDRAPGFVGGVGGVGGGAQPLQHNMSAQHGHSMPQADAAQPPPDLARTVSLYVGVESAPSFNLHQRLKGPGDSYLLHISSTTGATVTLRGRGSGMYDSPDHLHLFVSATNPKSFEEAKGLCVNLIDTVRAEHANSLAVQPQPVASQPPWSAQPQLPYQSGTPYPESGQPSPTGASYEQQAQAAYSQPSHSQAYAPRPADHPSSHSPYTSQPSPYPSTSSYPQPSSYPPSASAAMPPASYPPSMPPSSYPPANGFRPGAPPGAAPGAAPHPAGQHIQAVSPHGQGLSSPFHGGDLSLQHPTQHPFAAQQHTQQHSQQYSQHHASIGTYGPAVNQQQQQQSSAAHSDAHFSPYGHQGPPVRPPGPSAGPQAQQHAATGYAHQAQGFGQQQGQSYSVPTGQIHMQPDYGPQRQPELERGVPAMGGLAQQGGAGSQQGMSHQEMAQQAERKRRFTEQKRENQLQQGPQQQPNMPAYGLPQPQGGLQLQQGSRSPNPMPLKPNVAPVPMGPPPPRPPAQFGMGSMGPPPPRSARPQGAQVQLQPPVQGLVPYGDDD